MANYFDTFPKIEYQMKKNGIPKKVTDITKRVGFRKDFVDYVSDYYKHVISSGERPEMVSVQAYDTPLNHWILMMANEVVDPYHDWVRGYNALEEYIDKRYPNRYGLLRVGIDFDRTPLPGDFIHGTPTGTFPTIDATDANLNNLHEYEIVNSGDVNWTAIGSSSTVSGTKFNYNNETVTGTGTARPTNAFGDLAAYSSTLYPFEEVETGVTAWGIVYRHDSAGLTPPSLSGANIRPLILFDLNGGTHLTVGNTLRNTHQYGFSGATVFPDMTITSHTAARVIDSDASDGKLTYKLLSGTTDFTTNEYLTGSSRKFFTIEESGLEKHMPKYYEISKTNDDDTVEKLQVNRTLSSADIAALPSGFSTTPVAVTNMEYEFLKNTQDSEIFVVNENNISAIEKELIAKMEQ